MTVLRPATEPDPDAAPPERLLRINDVAEEVGLTTRAIRYYEEMGLLTPAARSDGGYRLYDQTDIERLRAIRASATTPASRSATSPAARGHGPPGTQSRPRSTTPRARSSAADPRDGLARVDRQLASSRTRSSGSSDARRREAHRHARTVADQDPAARVRARGRCRHDRRSSGAAAGSSTRRRATAGGCWSSRASGRCSPR